MSAVVELLGPASPAEREPARRDREAILEQLVDCLLATAAVRMTPALQRALDTVGTAAAAAGNLVVDKTASRPAAAEPNWGAACRRPEPRQESHTAAPAAELHAQPC